MTSGMDAFQAILEKMRQEFLNELPERCFNFDDQILKLEKTSGNSGVFDELFRGVHSLKGSGGTHGLAIITSICHQLENLLTEAREKNDFGAAFVTLALAHVDLVRRVATEAASDQNEFAGIEAELGRLHRVELENRKSVLIVESSKLMSGLYKQVLENLPLKVTFMDSGVEALGRLAHGYFDLVVVGRELKEIGGIPLMAAVRFSQLSVRDIPAILISSKSGLVPQEIRFNAVIQRDQNLAANLAAEVRKILKV